MKRKGRKCPRPRSPGWLVTVCYGAFLIVFLFVKLRVNKTVYWKRITLKSVIEIVETLLSQASQKKWRVSFDSHDRVNKENK